MVQLVLALAAAIFHPSPDHPWNTVHHALFDREVEVGVPPCATGPGGCGELTPATLLSATVGRRVLIGGDEPQAFIGEDVWFLTEGARFDELLHALAAARTVDPMTAPLAAALLQNDCWERFDAIVEALGDGRARDPERLRRLLPPLAQLIRHLALPRATLAALPPNEAELARAFPAVLPGFAARDGWVELRTEANERRDDPVMRAETRHAERWGYRASFRVFVRPSTGPDWLAAHLQPGMRLPGGSRLLLLGSPLAIAREGELVALPIVTVAEVRVAPPDGVEPTKVAELRHEVLEARRARLLARPRVAGGFEQLAPTALVPMGATCMPNRMVELPVRAACVSCHGLDGARLTGPLRHGASALFLEGDPGRAARAVVAAKRETPTFRALRRYWSELR